MYQVQKKRKKVWWIVALFLCAFSVGVGAGFLSVGHKTEQEEIKEKTIRLKEETLPEEEPEEIADQAASVTLEGEALTPPEETYYVVSQGDKVCVFTIDAKGKRRFSHNLAIELDALRAEDKQLFYDGMTIYSKQDLSSLIEDFGS